MKPVNILFLTFAIFGLAAVGLMYIFDMKSMDAAIELLLKIEAAIVLLWICSALLTAMLGGKKDASE